MNTLSYWLSPTESIYLLVNKIYENYSYASIPVLMQSFKGYLRYKTTTSQILSSEEQVKNLFTS